MIRFVMMVMSFVASSVFVMTALSQPPEGGKDKKGQPGKEGKGAKGGGKDGKGPPRFELGKVLPPFAIEELNLTKEQEKKIADLEKEVKAKLEKILTAEQKKTLETLRPPGGGPGGKDGPGGKGGPPGGGPGGPPGGPPGDAPMPRVVPENADAANAGGIQWFATWDSGRLEAERTGRPILLVSAAPHCAGVSGIW